MGQTRKPQTYVSEAACGGTLRLQVTSATSRGGSPDTPPIVVQGGRRGFDLADCRGWGIEQMCSSYARRAVTSTSAPGTYYGELKAPLRDPRTLVLTWRRS
jgi:hypothetical protein